MLVHNLPQWHCVSFQKQFAPSLYGIWRSRINSALCVEVLLWPDMAIPPTEPSSNITIYCTAILRILSLLANNDFTCFTAVQSHHKYFTATSLHWDDEQSLFTHTFVHTTFPLEQWQVLQSSSHLTPSRVTCPLTEQGLLVTVLKATAVLEILQKLCLSCEIFVLLSSSEDLYLLDSGDQSCPVDTGSDIRWSHPCRWSQRYMERTDTR